MTLTAESLERLGQSLDDAIAEGTLKNLHAVVLLRKGELFFERYWSGEDERRGELLGHVTFGPETLHDLRSISKSVVGLLYGVALERGLVPPVDTPLLDAFPEHRDLDDGPRRRSMTVAHALTMTLGILWEEGTNYRDPRNPEGAMERAPDRVRFVLEQPMQQEPGTEWQYCGGATALLGALLKRGTGQTLLALARESLLDPLGIEAAEWVAGPSGEEAAASGLRLRPADLARLGAMALDGGRWQGRQLVPAEWLRDSFRPHIGTTDNQLGYGYQWWLASPKVPPEGAPVDWIAGFGNGGQRLTLFPRSGSVLVVNAGLYNDAEAWRVPVSVLLDHVLPALRKE